MPDVKDLILSTFLNSDRVKALERPIIKILNEGAIATNKFGKVILNLKVKDSEGKEFTWTPNLTSMKNLSRSWGTDSKNWVGKYVKLSCVKTLIRGEEKEIIVGHPVVLKKKEEKIEEEIEEYLEEEAPELNEPIEEEPF